MTYGYNWWVGNSGWFTSGRTSESTSNCRLWLVRTNSIQVKDKDSSCYFHHQEGLNTPFMQPENSTWTILVSDIKFPRLDENNVKTEPPMEETLSFRITSPNTDLGSLHQEEASAATSTVEQRQPGSSEPQRTSTRNRKQTSYGRMIPDFETKMLPLMTWKIVISHLERCSENSLKT